MSSQQVFNVSECAFGSDEKGRPICSRPAVIDALKSWIKLDPTVSREVTIAKAKSLAKCDSESCLYKNKTIANWLRKSLAVDAKTLLKEDFKPSGPYNKILPLNDSQIDHVLLQWQTDPTTHFYAIEYQIADFADHPEQSELAEFDFAEKIAQGFRCFGVVLNTTTYNEAIEAQKTGKPAGKHWFGMFLDFRAAFGDEDGNWRKNPKQNIRSSPAATIEFFNSSGNLPTKHLIPWLEKQETDLPLAIPGLNVFSVIATLDEQQQSKVECGVYILYYIYARLYLNMPCTQLLRYRLRDEDAQQVVRNVLFRHSE